MQLKLIIFCFSWCWFYSFFTTFLGIVQTIDIYIWTIKYQQQKILFFDFKKKLGRKILLVILKLFLNSIFAILIYKTIKIFFYNEIAYLMFFVKLFSHFLNNAFFFSNILTRWHPCNNTMTPFHVRTRAKSCREILITECGIHALERAPQVKCLITVSTINFHLIWQLIHPPLPRYSLFRGVKNKAIRWIFFRHL